MDEVNAWSLYDIDFMWYFFIFMPNGQKSILKMLISLVKLVQSVENMGKSKLFDFR